MRIMVAATLLGVSLVAMAPAAVAQEKAPPIATKSGILPEPAPGKGQVVFFRPGSMLGMALGCTVHEGDAEVARLGSGKFYVVPEAPGKHAFYTEGMRKDQLTLEVEEGETYFVRCNIGSGLVSGSANLSPSDRAAFAKKAKGLKMWAGKDKPDS